MKYIYVVLILSVLGCSEGYGGVHPDQTTVIVGDGYGNETDVKNNWREREYELNKLQEQIDKLNKKLNQIFSSGNAIKMTMELEDEFQGEFDELKAEVEELRKMVEVFKCECMMPDLDVK